MQPTIGQRLAAARKNQGVRLQDAADATHIRALYLEALENDQFAQIPLADVYKRGFVKIYARYLRLDPEVLLEDFPSAQPDGRSRRHPAAVSRTAAGGGTGNDSDDAPSTGGVTGGVAVTGANRSRSDDAPAPNLTEKRLGIVLWTLIGIAAIGLVALIVSSFVGDDDGPGGGTTGPQKTAARDGKPAGNAAAGGAGGTTAPARQLDYSMVVSVTKPLHVRVYQVGDKKKLLERNMTPSEPVRVSCSGSVQIYGYDTVAQRRTSDFIIVQVNRKGFGTNDPNSEFFTVDETLVRSALGR
ncbi:MAG: helix-turn-helix domain-containing protein [Puniceicoccales bacterium]|jgi:transcriptional regulator with XRE-family HTH domain|nr:helix-turn-helix domain-containing protein [Puniceicoccales bacterium]